MGNKKANIIFISTLIICIIIGIIYYLKTSTSLTETSPIFSKNSKQVISDSSNTINLTLPENTTYKVVLDENYLLKLENETNIISISKNEVSSFMNEDLYSLISLDKDSFIQNFDNIKTQSDIRESTVNNYQSYNYSFSFIENDTEYLVQIFWIKTDTSLYTIDLRLPYELINQESQEFIDILYSFAEI